MADTVFMQCPLAAQSEDTILEGLAGKAIIKSLAIVAGIAVAIDQLFHQFRGMDFHLCDSGMDKALFKNLYGAFQMAVAPKQTRIGKISGRDLRGI